MSSIDDFLSATRVTGVKLWLENGQLCYQTPKGALTAERLDAIRARKNEIISYLKRAPSLDNLPPLIPQPRAGLLPLGFGQQMMWSWARQFGKQYTLFEYSAFRLRGALDVGLLKQCLDTLVVRHETLRTRILVVNDNPVQAIDESGDCNLEFVDLSLIPVQARENEARRKAEEFLRRPSDLASGPSFRSCLLNMSDNDHIIVLWLPQIIADAWSIGLLKRQLMLLYAAHKEGRPPKLPETPLQFADYVLWKHKAYATIMQLHLPYWKAHLAGAPPLNLPTEGLGSQSNRFEGALLSFALSRDLTADLHELCRREKVTLFIAMFAAFQAVLHFWSGQSDIVVGVVGAQRGMAELQNVMGFFANFAPMRTDTSGDPSFCELLQRVYNTALEAHEHYYPHLENLAELLQSAEPFCKVQFHFNPVVVGVASDMGQEGFGRDLTEAEFDLELQQNPIYEDFVLTLFEGQDTLIGRVLYKKDVFGLSSISHFVSCYQRFLKEIIRVPKMRLSELHMAHSFNRL
jgi:hypothetical protein